MATRIIEIQNPRLKALPMESDLHFFPTGIKIRHKYAIVSNQFFLCVDDINKLVDRTTTGTES